MSQRKARRAQQLAARRAAKRAAKDPSRRSRWHSSRREWWIAGISVVVAGAVIAGIVVTHGSSRPAQASAAAAAPKDALEISGTDPITGKQVNLAAYAGKPIVLNVWGSWCPGCNAEASDLERFARTHPQAQVIGDDLNDTKAGARAFYQRWGWTHPSIFDPNGTIAARLGLTGTPTTYFLDRQHRIVTQIVGASNLAGFDHGLKVALAAS
jgi:thiol-disulfide isomerase/thioredoxin